MSADEQIRPMRHVSASVLTALATVAAVATAVGFGLTASAGSAAAWALAATGAGMCIALLLIGSSRWVGLASVPMVAVVVLEAGYGEGSSWVRSILLGCLWFVTLELSWEAIERREPAEHSAASELQRVREVVTVVALALVTGTVAVSFVSVAPLRSVLVQALVIGSVLAGFVVLVRRSAPGRSPAGTGSAQ